MVFLQHCELLPKNNDKEFFDSDSFCDDVSNKELLNHKKQIHIIEKTLSMLKRNFKRGCDLLEERLDRIESFLVKIAPKHNVLRVFSIEDEEEFDERIFVLKVDKETSLADRRKILTSVTDETITYCQNNNLYNLFMVTSIFIRR